MGQGLTVESLDCEYRRGWLGAGCGQPRFNWKLGSDRRNTVQTAYRLQVAAGGGSFESPLWDSGKVDSDRSIQVYYEGPALEPRTLYYYRVKVWDGAGRESDWSREEWWETALGSSASAEEWQARWITPDPARIGPAEKAAFLLRRSFTLRSGIREARIYASAAGLYELYLNGQRVGEDLFTPGWTAYESRLQYQTYDVTGHLREGGNALGVQLGDGWYKSPLTWQEGLSNLYGDRRAVLLQLHVRYEDGTEETVGTDGTWRSATGPVLLSELYEGEIYDAGLERRGWSRAEYDASDWAGTEVLELPYSTLVPQENWPVRVTEVLKPQQVVRTPDGATLLDMGQNMVGRIRMRLAAPKGAVVRLTHAEVLDKEGNFYAENLRSAKQVLKYTASGDGEEEYAPAFTFMGFRFVKVEGLENWTDERYLNSFTGEVIHSDMPRTGEFECSDPLVNRLQANILWGQRGNFLDVPTDCPQRDERLGWTGDAQVFVGTAAYNFQVGPFFTKWLRDLKADQKQDGSVPFVIPDVLKYSNDPNGDSSRYTSAAWGDAAVICPWSIFLAYGDDRLLAEQYGSMKAWVEYIRSQGEDEHLWNTGFHFGDWLGLDAKEGSYVGATPRDLIATAFYAYSTRLVRDAAVALGHAEDVRTYSERLAKIEARFRYEFVTPGGRLAAPTQTAHALVLMFGLAEGETRMRIARDLNDLVVSNDYHLTTGFVGTPHLCQVLSDNGYHETAVKLLMQESYPSWLYSVTQGATTIWEHWDGIKPDGSLWSRDMNSYNHYAYGAIGEWMYRTLAGLDRDGSVPAYKRILIRPRFAAGKLDYARTALESPYGRIESGWTVDGSGTEVHVRIPANAEAEVVLPKAPLSRITESGTALERAPGIRSVTESESEVRLLIGSGEYKFKIAP